MSKFLRNHEIRLLNTRNLLKESGLSRVQLAEKIGMTYNLLSQYIGKNPGKKIGDDTAEKIEQAFDKPLGYLDQMFFNEDISTLHSQKIKFVELEQLMERINLLADQGKLSPKDIAEIEKSINGNLSLIKLLIDSRVKPDSTSDDDAKKTA